MGERSSFRPVDPPPRHCRGAHRTCEREHGPEGPTHQLQCPSQEMQLPLEQAGQVRELTAGGGRWQGHNHDSGLNTTEYKWETEAQKWKEEGEITYYGEGK